MDNLEGSGMHEGFRAHVEALHPKLNALLEMPPVTRGTLPKVMPRKGVYLFSENGRHLYVGRSNGIRKRLGRHCRKSAKHNMASFAFLLARETTGRTRATHRKGEGSRVALADDPLFGPAFVEAKERIRRMEVRYVEEEDPTRQALLEIYVALALGDAVQRL
jgi:hypothetical protein